MALFVNHPNHIEHILCSVIDGVSARRAVAGRAPASLRASVCRLIGAGKAVSEMAVGLLDEVGCIPVSGVLVGPPGTVDRLRSYSDLLALRVFDADHPLPTERNVAASIAVEAFARAGGEERLVVLLSGGASAHLALPYAGLSLDDIRHVVERLLKAGAPIQDLNTVRSQLEVLKGGGLARLAFPSRIDALVLSDVVGDDPAIIASGPLTHNPLTASDALRVLDNYGVTAAAGRVVEFLRLRARRDEDASGGSGARKAGDQRCFDNVRTTIVGSNVLALDAAAKAAESLGFDVSHREAGVQGDAALAGRRLAQLAISAGATGVREPVCILLGGETTVTVRGTGVGGRNQELALAAAVALRDAHRQASGDAQARLARIAIASFATDGTDGPTDAAGAYASTGTCAAALSSGQAADRALANNDSHAFFESTRSLLRTGPTGTNVNDVSLAIVYPA